MRQGRDPRSGGPERTVTNGGAAPARAAMSRRAMIKTMGLGTAALAVPGLVAGCSSAGGRTQIVFEETKPEVVPYFNTWSASSTRARTRSR